ncbi:MAG: hypothetical protein ACP5UZ_08295 [Thermoplasmata archaeon]
MRQFWNSEITEASWNGIKDLAKEIEFVLIGGWAVYLYSNLQKSRDIDIIIGYEELSVLSRKHNLVKNERLKKYEIKLPKYDIDIYLPDYSPLPIPPKDIMKEFTLRHKGFTLPTQEVLLCLKIGAAIDRKGSFKGDKDAIDILGLLFYSDINKEKLRNLIARYDLRGYLDFLISVLSSFNLRNLLYLNIDEHEFSKLKRYHIETLREIRTVQGS